MNQGRVNARVAEPAQRSVDLIGKKLRIEVFGGVFNGNGCTENAKLSAQHIIKNWLHLIDTSGNKKFRKSIGRIVDDLRSALSVKVQCGGDYGPKSLVAEDELIVVLGCAHYISQSCLKGNDRTFNSLL